MVSAALRETLERPVAIQGALPAPHHAARVFFDSHTYADFKYIWVWTL